MVLLTGDCDFASSVRRLVHGGYPVVLIHRGVIRPAMTMLGAPNRGTWDLLVRG